MTNKSSFSEWWVWKLTLLHQFVFFGMIVFLEVDGANLVKMSQIILEYLLFSLLEESYLDKLIIGHGCCDCIIVAHISQLQSFSLRVRVGERNLRKVTDVVTSMILVFMSAQQFALAVTVIVKEQGNLGSLELLPQHLWTLLNERLLSLLQILHLLVELLLLLFVIIDFWLRFFLCLW